MTIHRLKFNPVSCRYGHTILFVALLLAATLGTIIASSAIKRQKVIGEIITELYQKDEGGKWKVIDRMRSTANFEATTSQSSAQTDFIWHGRSEHGCEISVRWGGRNRYHIDIQSGLVEFEVPIEFAVNGKAVTFPIKCTNGSIHTPFSTVSGQPAVFKGGTLTAVLVGTGSFQASSDLFKCSGSSYDERSRASSGRNEEFVVVLRGEGRVTSLD